MKNLNVYVISANNYRLAKQNLIGKSCYNCMNGTCKVQNTDYKNNVNCLGWENRGLVMKAIFFNNYNIDELKKIPDFEGVVLTDEEYKSKKLELLKQSVKIQELI